MGPCVRRDDSLIRHAYENSICDSHAVKPGDGRLCRCGDLPVRQFCVESPLQKYFCFRPPQIKSTTLASHPTRGAYRDRHGRGAGCGGRGSVLRATGSQGGLAKGL